MKKTTMLVRLMTGFVSIFALAALLLYVYMSHMLESQTVAQIKEDMRKLQLQTYDYILQYTMFHEVSADNVYEHWPAIVSGIARSSGNHVAYYNVEGQLLHGYRLSRPSAASPYGYETELLRQTKEEHLNQAAGNRSIVTLGEEDGKRLALLSMPVLIDDGYQGALRMTGDYTDDYAHNAAILRSLSLFGLLLLLIVSGFALLLVKRTMRPLAALSRAMRELGEGRDSPLPPSVHDSTETETLAASFQHMKDQLGEHMGRLSEERNRVISLEQSRRRFYQNVTHELKTPLATISGYAQIIGAPSFNDPVFLERAAHAIEAESKRLHGMVVDVIELSRSGTLEAAAQPATFDLSVQLSECCADMSLKAGRYHLRIETVLQASFVTGGVDELRQVWLNLLDNAIKYSEAGTDIEVALAADDQAAIVRISNTPDDNVAQSLEDALVFDAFYRGPSSSINEKTAGSAGLGLAISKAIIDRHGGDISFSLSPKTAAGRRVTVEARLPRCL